MGRWVQAGGECTQTAMGTAGRATARLCLASSFNNIIPKSEH